MDRRSLRSALPRGIPADDWGGRSWTFWQYTSDGVVPGISGRVDLNRDRFSTFIAATC